MERSEYLAIMKTRLSAIVLNPDEIIAEVTRWIEDTGLIWDERDIYELAEKRIYYAGIGKGKDIMQAAERALEACHITVSPEKILFGVRGNSSLKKVNDAACCIQDRFDDVDLSLFYVNVEDLTDQRTVMVFIE